MNAENINVLLNSALKLHNEGLLDQANTIYENILKIDKKNFYANHLLGEVYQLKFKDSHNESLLYKSIECFKQSLSININSPETCIKLALSLLWIGEIEEANKYFKKSNSITNTEKNFLKKDLEKLDNKKAIESIIKHEFEQLTYIDGDPDGIRNTKFSSDYYNFLEQEYAKIKKGNFKVEGLNDKIKSKLLKQLYNKPPKIVQENFINIDNDILKIESDYKNATPEIVVVDNFLNKEALHELYKFCLSANIFKYPYANGYMGAFLEKGLSNTFILQLAHNLKNTFTQTFHNLHLTEAWIYKYDSEQDGINVHADDAKVNVNFWITPEVSNLDADTGGLIIWDKFPQENWNFEDYNYIKNSTNIEKMLNDNNAKQIKIPYKENRAVIFNSKLFHATDKYRFKNNFVDRRLNVTLLYS
ncbi:MAG: hypothetical protein VX864_03530 [Pseudomonadota bacterium]|nr:hypothetical protein [Pseudomonadota bacterium]